MSEDNDDGEFLSSDYEYNPYEEYGSYKTEYNPYKEYGSYKSEYKYEDIDNIIKSVNITSDIYTGCYDPILINILYKSDYLTTIKQFAINKY
jgi:hypothetical protein